MFRSATRITIFTTFPRAALAGLINPSSVVAISQLGDLAVDAGDCREATTEWRRAESLYKTDGDPDLGPVSSSMRDDAVNSLQTIIKQCR